MITIFKNHRNCSQSKEACLCTLCCCSRVRSLCLLVTRLPCKRTNDTFSFPGFVSLLVFDMPWAASFLSVVGLVSTGCLWSAWVCSLLTCKSLLWLSLQLFIPHTVVLTHVWPRWSPPRQRKQFQAFCSTPSFLNWRIFEIVTTPDSVMSFAHFAGAMFLNFRFLRIPKECLLAPVTSWINVPVWRSYSSKGLRCYCLEFRFL